MLFVLTPKQVCESEKKEDNSYKLHMGQSNFSYELTFWFISIENGCKQKNTLKVEIIQFFDG